MTKLLTIGHSTLDINVFIAALKENGCRMLVDVRHYPGSRHCPQFGKDSLAEAIRANGLRYKWMGKELGGRRSVKKGSVLNAGWRNASFRGYADFMQTPEFVHGLNELTKLKTSLAIMCAEAVPWRCHRSMISDAVLVRGIPVEAIMVKPNGSTFRAPHKLRDFARVAGDSIWYPEP